MDVMTKPQRLPSELLKKHSATFKMAGVFCLVLVLLIPLTMIRGVLHERLVRRNEAVSGITSTWGGRQEIVGPVLIFPFRYKFKSWKEQLVNGRQERIEVEETAVANAFVLPSELAISGTVSPDRLHRGIYEAIVYRGELEISGKFSPPDFVELGIAESDVQWENAQVTLAVSDLRGTGEMLRIKVGEQTREFAPGCRLNGYASGISARLPGIQGPGSGLDFRMTLDLKGSHGISFAPVGQQNRVRLNSAWTSPSFGGAFLPANRRVSAEGFEASWEVSWYGRSFPQQSTDQPGRNVSFQANAVAPSLFGVDFIAVVDSYRMVERAAKYGVLFIALIFTAFFLFEVLSALRIHTIQYLLVGAALCLFYLAILSLSEFFRFGYAYCAGAAASSLLIILYCLKVLHGGKRTAIIAAALIAIYTYLYVVLQLQDYSLLVGTAGLFVVLGIVMYSTRNLDWSTRE
jgi:inner membrane protein